MPNPPALRDHGVVAAFAAVLLIASLAYVALTFQWADAMRLLAGADLAWLVLGSGTAIIGYWAVRAQRWRILLGGMQVRPPFIDLYLCSSVALSLSVLTPLQAGEAFKVELLRKYARLERAPGYGAFLVERVADLYAVVAIGAVALVSPTPLHVAALVSLCVALPIAGFVALRRVKLPGRLGEFVSTVQASVSTPSALALLLFTTFLGWGFVALGWNAALYSLAIRLDLAQVLGLLSAVTLATIASFIPGGLGVADAGIVEMLKRYGVDVPLAQAGSLAVRFFTVLVVAMGAAHLVVLRLRSRLAGGAEP